MLSLAADPRHQHATAGTFWSQGRDGCIHSWALDTVQMSPPVADADAALALLDDLLPDLGGDTADVAGTEPQHGVASSASRASATHPTSASSAFHSALPIKAATFRSGFGSFCRMHMIAIEPNIKESVPETMKSDNAAAGRSGWKHRSALMEGDADEEHEVQRDGNAVGAAAGLSAGGDPRSDADTSFPAQRSGRSGAGARAINQDLYIAAPTMDAARIEVWKHSDYHADITHGGAEETGSGSKNSGTSRRVAVFSVPAAATEQAAAALGRSDRDLQDEAPGELMQSMAKSTGMAMCVQLIAMPAPFRMRRRQTSGVPATAIAEAQGHIDDDSNFSAYRNADGSTRHPDAPSLKDLLRQPQPAAGAGVYQMRMDVPSPAVASSAASSVVNQTPRGDELPVLLAVAYESGALFVLQAGPKLNSLSHRSTPADQRSGGGMEHRSDSHNHGDDHAESIAPEPDLFAPKSDYGPATAIITLPICRDPILTFSILEPSQRHPKQQSGVAGTSGSSVYCFSLDYETCTGLVLRKIRLSSPGCAISMPLRLPAFPSGVVVLGCWDSCARIVALDEDVDAQAATAVGVAGLVSDVLQWSGAGIYALAGTSAGNSESSGGAAVFNGTSSSSLLIATGSKDGRIALWSV